ncbi:MAG: ribosomal L7Ae/L30e/S12e/Gadd45 family protein [Oscillospiraceae bacterium]
MLAALQAGNKVVGAKQTRRALDHGTAATVFLASDADPRITEPLAQLAQETGVPVTRVDTMKALGEACSITVGAAVAALLKP